MNLVLGALLFTMRMSLVAQVPPRYAVVTWGAAIEAGVDPDTLGALLISESGGSWDASFVRSNGPMGLFQVMPMWADHFGVEREALLDPWTNARVAAHIVRYSIERHASCGGDHDWRAHFKCSRKGRDDCEAHVRPLLQTEAALNGMAPIKQVEATVTAWVDDELAPGS